MIKFFTIMDVKPVNPTVLMLSSIYTTPEAPKSSTRYLALETKWISGTTRMSQAVIKLTNFCSLILRLTARVGIETGTC
jgi:hypothetical protein